MELLVHCKYKNVIKNQEFLEKSITADFLDKLSLNFEYFENGGNKKKYTFFYYFYKKN